MLTTCPECRTTFRVTQDHLGLRRGLVRCGHCGVVFNAYDSLLAELVAPPDQPDRHEALPGEEGLSEGEVPELRATPQEDDMAAAAAALPVAPAPPTQPLQTTLQERSFK